MYIGFSRDAAHICACAQTDSYAQAHTHNSSLLSAVGLFSGIKIHHLVIKIADVSEAGRASWINRAAARIPGSAGQGHPAKQPCDGMPSPDSTRYAH